MFCVQHNSFCTVVSINALLLLWAVSFVHIFKILAVEEIACYGWSHFKQSDNFMVKLWQSDMNLRTRMHLHTHTTLVLSINHSCTTLCLSLYIYDGPTSILKWDTYLLNVVFYRCFDTLQDNFIHKMTRHTFLCPTTVDYRALFSSFIHSIPFHQALMVFPGKTAKQHTSSCQISMWRPIRDHLFGTTAIFLSLLRSLQRIFVISPVPTWPLHDKHWTHSSSKKVCHIRMHEWQKIKRRSLSER